MGLKILNIVFIVTFIYILANCALCSCSQNRDGTLNNSSNNFENTDNTQQSLPLTFGPETLDKLRSDPNFIAAFGNIPAFSNQNDKKQWLDRLNNIYHATIPEISKYEYPNGPVSAFGYSIDGVLLVGINSSKIVDKLFMDKIYKIFDSKASLVGVKEVPVVFVYQDNPVPTVIMDDPADVEPTPVQTTTMTPAKESKKTPGFKLLCVITELLGVYLYRRK